VESLYGGCVDSWNDHRIGMSLAIASTRCTKPLIINNPGCVKKSHTNFEEHFRFLGGKINI
jgi:3-phosphoshikimate 1-carboxyvinyltransferase